MIIYGCYPNLRDYSSHKLSPLSKHYVFLGYPSNYKGFRCFDPITNKIYISRHVHFNESFFPYPFLKSSTSPVNSSNSLFQTPSNFSTYPLPHSPPLVVPHYNSNSLSIRPNPSHAYSSTPPLSVSNFDQSPLFSSLNSQLPASKTHHMITRAQTGSLKPTFFSFRHFLPNHLFLRKLI